MTDIRTKTIAQLPLATSVSVTDKTLIWQDNVLKQTSVNIFSEVSFDSIASLRANSTLYGVNKDVFVKSYYTNGTTGGGVFIRVAGTAADNGGTIITDSVGQRWARVVDDGISALDFGAKGDGIANDTSALQAALNAAAGQILYIPEGTYMVSAGSNDSSPSGAYTMFRGALEVPSNISIKLEPSANIKCITTDFSHGSAFWCHNKTNITIDGGTFEGDRLTHTGVGGEQLHGIYIAGCSNVTICNTTCKNWWGDGILVSYSASGAASSFVTINNVYCDNNRRNNLSVVSCLGISVDNSAFVNANGTTPESGVDVEPDPGFIVSKARFSNCQFSGNAQVGFIAAPQGAIIEGLEVVNCVATSNGTHGFSIVGDSVTAIGGIALTNCRAVNNVLNGFNGSNNRQCNYTNCASEKNGSHGFLMRGETSWVRLTATSGSGNFTVGETVTNGSGASGIVREWYANSKTLFLAITSGTFAPGNTATGGTSGATITVVAVGVEPMSADNVFAACIADQNTVNGFYCEVMTERNVFANCTASGNNSGLRIDTDFHTVTGGRYSFNIIGVVITSGSSQNTVSGASFFGNQAIGISVNGNDNFIFGNFCRDVGIQGQGILVASSSGFNRLIANDCYQGGRFVYINRTDTTTVMFGNIETQNAGNFLSGNGSPESVVVAPVGSQFMRLDGGAATTLYVKETGTGNTGWVAK